MARIILASGSPRRRQLLREIMEDFLIFPAHVEELEPEEGIGRQLATENALRKARAVFEENRDCLVIGSDTTVALGLRIFNKPKDLEQAAEYLSQLSGRTHSVFTGVALLGPAGEETFCVESQVRFKLLSPSDIREYMELVHVLDKAGAYAIQEERDRIIEKFEGSLSAIMGLPIEQLALILGRRSDADRTAFRK